MSGQENQVIFKDFLLSRQASLRSPATLSYYQQKLGNFLKYLERENISFSELKAQHVRAFLSELQSHKCQRGNNIGGFLSSSSVHAHARSIKALCKFLLSEGYTEKPISFQMPSLEKKIFPALTEVELTSVLHSCSLRDKALVLLMVDSGLRLSEVANLKWGDINLDTGSVMVRHGKGAKDRVSFIGINVRRILLRYARTVSMTENAPVFQRKNSQSLTLFGIESIFRRLAKESGVHVHPHMLRRTCATYSIRAGMNLFHLQSLLGHSTLEMTRRYAQLVTTDIQEAHRISGPIDNLLFTH
jgi:site-specific recombinase XerD